MNSDRRTRAVVCGVLCGNVLDTSKDDRDEGRVEDSDGADRHGYGRAPLPSMIVAIHRQSDNATTALVEASIWVLV